MVNLFYHFFPWWKFAFSQTVYLNDLVQCNNETKWHEYKGWVVQKDKQDEVRTWAWYMVPIYVWTKREESRSFNIRTFRWRFVRVRRRFPGTFPSSRWVPPPGHPTPSAAWLIHAQPRLLGSQRTSSSRSGLCWDGREENKFICFVQIYLSPELSN